MITENSGNNQGFLLRVHEISKKYGNVKALQRVSLDIFSGEIIALVGDNGAGKSTLFKCLSGTIYPDKGFIEIVGKRFAGLTPKESVS